MRLKIMFLGLLAALLPFSVWAQEPTGVSVSGSGVVFGEPDLARVVLGVDMTDADPQEALAIANRAMTAVLSAVREAGVADKDIATTTLDFRREERRLPSGEVSETVYRVRNLVRVTVRDLDALGAMLSAASAAGANNIGGISFDLSDPKGLERQARALAVADARQKAEQLASEAGRELGELLEISEFGGAPINFDEGLGLRVAQAAVPVSGGQLSVQVNVSLRYALR